MGFGGAALKFGSTALYALEFGCAAVVLGIYSYFLAVEADRDARIPTWQKAVTGLSGAVVLYTIFAVLLTCCLGGKVSTTKCLMYDGNHANSLHRKSLPSSASSSTFSAAVP